MELRLGPEQRLPTTNTIIRARRFRIFVFTGKRRLGPLLPRHIVLIRRELLLPIDCILANFLFHDFPLAAYFRVLRLQYLIQRTHLKFHAEARIVGL